MKQKSNMHAIIPKDSLYIKFAHFKIQAEWDRKKETRLNYHISVGRLIVHFTLSRQLFVLALNWRFAYIQTEYCGFYVHRMYANSNKKY